MGKDVGAGAPAWQMTRDELEARIGAYFAGLEGAAGPFDGGGRDKDGDSGAEKGDKGKAERRHATLAGLYLAMGADEPAARRMEASAELGSLVRMAKLKVREYAEEMIYEKGGAHGAEFFLKNGFKDSYGDAAGPADAAAEGWAGLPGRLLGMDYVDIYRDIKARRHRFYDFRGGRGSLKSTFCALALADAVMSDPTACAVCIRQVKDTLKDSVYAQMIWALAELGVMDRFECRTSPLEIARPETGQAIYFRGADDPGKLKSLTPGRGKHFGVLWIEEADQIQGAEAFRSIVQSVMRGADDIIVMRSYNTPKSRHHYINIEAAQPGEGRAVHHSYYFNAPREWLGRAFFEEAERLRAANERAYRHEYLGEATGSGGAVFENVSARAVSDEEIARLARAGGPRYGLDWGWYPDPTAFVAVYYDKRERAVYIVDEIFCNKTGNEALAAMLERYKAYGITADSSEKKSIEAMRAMGYKMKAARKGPGSVEFGIKWLASQSAIVIDRARAPRAAEEFLRYEYERDGEGNVVSGYPDRDNHGIDAVRYALEAEIMGARAATLDRGMFRGRI